MPICSSNSRPDVLLILARLVAVLPSRRALPVDSSVTFWPEMVRRMT